jgi:hypothetical protein
MEWVSVAEEYCGMFGWGARGKYIGISRMLGDGDKNQLTRGKVFASTRPRGILSGFLTIVPSLGYAVYLPPIAAKIGPQRIRMRISEKRMRSGAIFSAYTTRDKRLVIEDVLVWDNQSVWTNTPFEQRWNRLVKEFFTSEYINDVYIQQGLTVEPAKYVSLAQLKEPDGFSVVEFIPDIPNHKRLIWMAPKGDASYNNANGPRESVPRAVLSNGNSANTKTVAQANGNVADVLTTEAFTDHTIAAKYVRRETAMGPDVYSVWNKDTKERIGISLVRTLAVSRKLRAVKKEEIDAVLEWNRQFDKWEIVDVCE